LALLASSLCYVSYNHATKLIGVVKTSVYIYFVPAINVIVAYFVLGETITPLGIVGLLVLTAGLVVSELGAHD
jgi:drug/metabolite transporter (DMT)-like permease